MEGRPWANFKNRKPVTASQVASLLQPFGIRPSTKRDGAATFKGYEYRQFSEAFSRYLRDSAATPSQPVSGSRFDD
jgi:hypothetical protein